MQIQHLTCIWHFPLHYISMVNWLLLPSRKQQKLARNLYNQLINRNEYFLLNHSYKNKQQGDCHVRNKHAAEG